MIKNKFLAGFISLCAAFSMLLWNLTTLTAKAAPYAETHTAHCVCGGEDIEHGGHSDVEYTPLNKSATELTDGIYSSKGSGLEKVYNLNNTGNYYLTSDITLDGTLVIRGGSSLCLNGHELKFEFDTAGLDTRSDNATIGINFGGGTLNICDCKTGGSIAVPEQEYEVTDSHIGVTMTKRTDPIAINLSGGTLNFYGGTVECGATCIKLASSSAANLYGGMLTGDSGYELDGESGSFINICGSGFKGGSIWNGGELTMTAGSVDRIVARGTKCVIRGGRVEQKISADTICTVMDNAWVNRIENGNFTAEIHISGGTIPNGISVSDYTKCATVYISGSPDIGGTVIVPARDTAEGALLIPHAKGDVSDVYTGNTLSIRAAKPGDGKYVIKDANGLGKFTYYSGECELEYDSESRAVKLNHLYTFTGAAGSNGWYNSNVTITPPTGSEISMTNNNDYADKLTLTSSVSDCTIYLKNASGNVTSISLGDIKIDSTATITVTGNTAATGSSDKVTIEVSAGESGIAKVEVQKGSGSPWEDITASYRDGYTVTENARYVFRVTNNAGRTASKYLTYENLGTELSFTVTLTSGEGYTLTGSAAPVADGGSYTFTFALKDKYYKTDKFAVKVNGTPVTLGEDGQYTIDNITADKTVTVEGVAKDDKSPVITGVSDGGTYYTTRTVTIDEEALSSLTLNGVPAASPITLTGNTDATYIIEAADKAGNTAGVTVTMKPISSISAPIDNITAENVKSDNENTIKGIKAAAEAVDMTGAAAEEKSAVKAIVDNCAKLLGTIAKVRDELSAINTEMGKYTADNVTPSDRAEIEALIRRIDALGGNLTETEKSSLTAVKNTANALIQTISDNIDSDITAITGAADGYDIDEVTLQNKADIEKVIADIDAILESEDIANDKKTALQTAKTALEEMKDRIDAVAAEVKDVTDKVNGYEPSAVTSSDKAEVEALVSKATSLLDNRRGNLTGEQKTALEQAVTTANDLIKKINEDNTGDSGNSGKLTKDTQSGEGAPGASIGTELGDLSDAVLNSEERELMKNGADIKVALTVNDATDTAPAADKELIDNFLTSLEGYRRGQFLDINLIKEINGQQLTITQTNAPITITLDIPENLRAANREYFIIRVHDGEATLLDDLDNVKYTLTFKTDKFSTYVLAYTEAKTTNPDTGTSAAGLTVIMAISAVSLIASIAVIVGAFSLKRKKYKAE